MTYAAIYLIGLGVVWIAAAVAINGEPTAHGQGVLASMGCALGILWPLFVAYLIVASPWLAYTWYTTRGER